MSIQQFLTDINGIAQLWATDGQFLGLLSSNPYDTNSISNFHGIYGSPHGLYSIRNLHGMYGGEHGLYSPYNLHCINPPVIFYQNQAVLIVSKNTYFQANGLPIVDPDFLVGVYAQAVSSPMDRLNQAAHDTQNHLNRSAAIIASMFQ
ncbi:hypothetical protein [Nostoc sp. CCY0012]|uniref:hypothetical protein n=1 Tax=Nostoc sp. CCY0012 TaxID=1056123 RepID=UPI0039C62888